MRPISPALQNPEVLLFADFQIDLRSGELHRNGSVVRLQRQPFELLAHLARHAGEIVSREELRQRLWQDDTFVDFDNGLNAAISKVREALGDSAEQPRFVETLPRRGYRFIADVQPAHPIRIPMPPKAGSPAQVPESTEAAPHRILAISHARARTWRGYLIFGGVLLAVLAATSFVWVWSRGRAVPKLALERRLTANPPEAPITAAAISPDGKYLAYADITGVYIRQMEGGETRTLSVPPGSVAAPAGWFPDSTHVLLGMEGTGGAPPSLWKVSILGGGPQRIVENATGGVVSPNGQKLAFLRDVSGALEIWIAESDGSNSRRLVEDAGPDEFTGPGSFITHPLYNSYLSRLAWSPGGDRIAYIRRLAPGYPDPTMDNGNALETVGVIDGIHKSLMESAQVRPEVYWCADGRLLYAYRDEAAAGRNDVGIWSLKVDEKSGAPESKPRQLTEGSGRIGGMSVTTDGKRLVIWRTSTEPTVFVTDFDPGTRHFRTPRRLTLDENMNVATAWTPDSRAVLFDSNRNGNRKLFRQPIDQAAPEVVAEGDRDFILPRVNPDGTEILYSTPHDPGDPQHLGDIMSVPLQGGTRRVVLHNIPIGALWCSRMPSKLCLIGSLTGSTLKLLSFYPDSATVQDFGTFEVNRNLNLGLSPDGSQLAMLPDPGSKVVFMSIRDRRTHDVEVNGWDRLTTIDWTGDGKSVYVIARTSKGIDQVVEVEPSGKNHVVLEGDTHTHFWWAIQSPDGQHILIEAVTGENNVWVVDNF